MDIINKLYDMQDKKYLDFQSKLIPNIDKDSIIGVRSPDLKKIAKDMYKSDTYKLFLDELPHKYFEENQLHSFIISEIKDYNDCVSLINKFLPYVDNWATCDQLNPKCLKKDLDNLIIEIKKWIKSSDTYTIRFGIITLMRYFLDDKFDKSYLKLVSNIKSSEYYVNMMISWFFATALAKQYDSTIYIIENKILDDWTHNKTIQKCIESNRITLDKKEYLKSMKV